MSARPRLSSAKVHLLVDGLLFLVLFVGCGRSPELPMTQAQRLFHEGDFNAAVGVLDGAIAKSTEAVEKANLLALKGRCYWELAHRTDQPDTRTAHLKQAISILTQSIETQDNAESRHIRALVYETLGEGELAAADKLTARELDETFRRAYLNEKPERVLLETNDPTSSLSRADEPLDDPEQRDAVQEPDGQDQGKRPGVADWTVPSPPSDPLVKSADEPARRAGRNPLSRARDVPWTSSGAAAMQDRSNDPFRPGAGRSGPLAHLPSDADERSAEGEGTESDRRRLLSGERSVAGDATTEEQGAERDESAEGEAETGEERSGGETESRDPWIPPRPTWPSLPPSQLGAPPGWNSPPTTGLVGPIFEGRDSMGARQTVPSAPTTGITGPPGFAAGQASPLAGTGMAGSTLPPTATTGIGTAPLRLAPGTGPAAQSPPATGPFPQSEPQAGLAVTPQTRAGGGSPSTAPTRGFMPGFGGGIEPEHLRFGPHYNPLRPSPLTMPQPGPQMPVRPPMAR